jgi:hypothetical protein
LTIDKVKLNAVLAAADNASDYVNILSGSVMLADPDNQFNSTFINIFEGIESIEAWANQKLLEANQEEVMTGFLSEMKVVFDKYTAKIELGSTETGYGEAYGEGETAVGIKLTAVLAGVTATKEINKSVIVSSDLV